METIFFEKQEAALCAQHALNMLLQGAYYSPNELSDIALKLDNEENGVLSSTSRNKKSVNMDDTGFFSIQVVCEALKPFDLELTSIDHPSMATVKEDPLKCKAFICNMHEHWFTLRKFASQWFALNSIKAGPELLSDTYISMYLHQLRQEGYSIFVVQGVLPHCDADDFIAANPVLPAPPPKKKKEEKPLMGIGRRLGNLIDDVLGGPINAQSEEERQLQEAIELSMVPPDNTPSAEDEELQAAIRLSMQQENEATTGPVVRNIPIEIVPSSNSTSDADAIRRQRTAFLERFK